MKNFFRIAALFLAFGFVAAFAGCSNASGGGNNSAPAPETTPTPTTTTYTVTFNSNGGSDVTSQTVTSGQTATKPSDPARDHFNFVEWCSDQACQTAFDFATPITDDITLYAKWSSLPVYVVTFVLNGGKYGSSDTYTQNVESGSKAVRPSSNPTKDDTVSDGVTTKYAFVDWYVDTGCGTLFDFDATTISGPTTIYAKWSESKYCAVTFDLQGGKIGEGYNCFQIINVGSKAVRPIGNLTKNDSIVSGVTTKYAFVNWYADSEFGTLFDFDATTINGPTTVYAKWNETKYYSVSIPSYIAYGRVSCDALEPILPGTIVTLTVNPVNGYVLASCDVKDSSQNSVAVTNGKFIMPNSPVFVTASFERFDINKCPLTIEAKEAGTTVTFNNNYAYDEDSGLGKPVTYQINGGELKTIQAKTTATIALSDVGDKICFYGNNSRYHYNNSQGTISSPKAILLCDKECFVYGNMMSLVDSEGFENAKKVKTCAFETFFANNTKITNKPGVDLVLPATTLANRCYDAMFYGCTGLTSAPTLPVNTLAKYCYESMFYGCTGLTTAPVLPATTLAEGCYRDMFENCTGLTTAPVLPATTLAKGCYSSMFYRCTGLTTAPVLSATTLANHCYSGMFLGCTGLTSAPELPVTILAEYCYEQMFRECTNLTSAPVLPATTLFRRCYSGMFMDCKKLTSAPVLHATRLAVRCYWEMFQGCTGLTSAPVLPAMTLEEMCYNSMFTGCANLTNSPVLPATTLADDCYGSMFVGCRKLTTVTCLATSLSAAHCSDWLINVASNGTFVKSPSLKNANNSNLCIPSSWGIVDYQE